MQNSAESSRELQKAAAGPLTLSSLRPQAFVATGTNLSLQFFPANLHGDQRQVPTREYVDFERETGKHHSSAQGVSAGIFMSDEAPKGSRHAQLEEEEEEEE
ncbi:unnamed protein product [Menidia menidia]|uniref:(Atlantic silverside) hypothetical protein n=1 Tax=Menidia menidia TaxID=238744 RepID=A0A8S4BD42_9TELE|nr:unnamed protein product [Menidia menidia]